ncbi:MAG TPA: MBL fold metallo-hydrolase [Thermomicrobiales bacterium]|nr:MBL fold metallo-hydrolase [Thermomicrobiales bacterium]
MKIWLLRNATLVLDYGERTILVDPMLDPAGARPAVANTPNDLRNPLVELPLPIDEILSGIDALLVTHLHQDHFDSTAKERLAKTLPLIGQPEDVERLTVDGFTNLLPVDDERLWEGIAIRRTRAQHGTGEIAKLMAPVSGFVLEAEGEPTLYLAGDTIWYEPVAAVLATHRPDVIVLNGSGARFNVGDPILMTAEEIAAVQQAAPWATVIVDHLEAINHCLETRAYIDRRLGELGARDRVIIPADGELALAS